MFSLTNRSHTFDFMIWFFSFWKKNKTSYCNIKNYKYYKYNGICSIGHEHWIACEQYAFNQRWILVLLKNAQLYLVRIKVTQVRKIISRKFAHTILSLQEENTLIPYNVP